MLDWFGFEVEGPARVRELDESLARLSRLEPEAAARLGELAVVFVEADGVVQVEERELLALLVRLLIFHQTDTGIRGGLSGILRLFHE